MVGSTVEQAQRHVEHEKRKHDERKPGNQCDRWSAHGTSWLPYQQNRKTPPVVVPGACSHGKSLPYVAGVPSSTPSGTVIIIFYAAPPEEFDDVNGTSYHLAIARSIDPRACHLDSRVAQVK